MTNTTDARGNQHSSTTGRFTDKERAAPDGSVLAAGLEADPAAEHEQLVLDALHAGGLQWDAVALREAAKSQPLVRMQLEQADRGVFRDSAQMRDKAVWQTVYLLLETRLPDVNPDLPRPSENVVIDTLASEGITTDATALREAAEANSLLQMDLDRIREGMLRCHRGMQRSGLSGAVMRMRGPARIAAAGIAYPVSWDEMGSSEKDSWEEAVLSQLDAAQRRSGN